MAKESNCTIADVVPFGAFGEGPMKVNVREWSLFEEKSGGGCANGGYCAGRQSSSSALYVSIVSRSKVPSTVIENTPP